MLSVPQNYSIYPSVIPANEQSEIIIAPAERAFVFNNGASYDLTVISINSDEVCYHKPTTHKKFSVEAKDGVIRFLYTFESEQEHIILLNQEDKLLQEFHVFSLYEDLYELTALKGDLHGHSCRSDGKRDPAALAGHYREQGYDFFALTDHNRYHHGTEIDEVFDGIDTGLTRVFGEELHPLGSVLHIVHVCGESSVCDLYIKDIEGFEKAVEEYKKKVPANVPEQYKSRYAKAMWTCDRIHETGGVAIFPHPYWRPERSRIYHSCDEFAVMMLKSGMFDSFEIVGAMGQDGINRAIALWADLRADGLKIGVVGSSDTHEVNGKTFGNCFTVCFARSNSREDIREAILAGNTVAVEATGDERCREYRAYGSLRLVTYAQFLLKYYFPSRQRICQGEGVSMRAYSMGEAPRELVELEAKLSKDYTLRFFGRKEPKLPSAEMMEFEDKWREVHANGPKGKGSIFMPDYKME